jgi:hypothetical protein
LELSRNTWVNLGLKKGRGRFLNFSDAPLKEENIFSIFLAVKAKPILLDYVIGVYLVINLSSFLVSASAGRMRKFYSSLFDQSNAAWD